MENYYKYFGVEENASFDEIKQAYLSLIKKYHPDIYPGDKSYAEQKTAEINKRYLVLKDEKSRREYDRKLHPQRVVVVSNNQPANNNYQKTNSYTNSNAQDVDGIFTQMFKRLKNAFKTQKNNKNIKKNNNKVKNQQKNQNNNIKQNTKQKAKSNLNRDKAGLTIIIILVAVVILAFLLLLVLI